MKSCKKDNEVCYENWFDTGIVREGKELAKLLNEKGTEIFVTEEDVVRKGRFLNNARCSKCLLSAEQVPQISISTPPKRNNVIVVNTPGRNAVGVAEMVVGMMISVSRNFYKGAKNDTRRRLDRGLLFQILRNGA